MSPDTSEQNLIDRLIAVGGSIVQRGLTLASGGNISARVPGTARFIVTAAGTWLDRLTPEDFAVVDLNDGPSPSGPAPSSEWKLHHRVYLARPDVHAVVHVHPQHTILVDALGEPIRLLTLDHAYYVRTVGRVPYYPSGSDALADEAAKQSLDHDAVLLAFHGCSTFGADIDMAYRRALNLEEAAVATYRLLALGNTDLAFPQQFADDLHHA